jgi:CheY-like chemotaxis protein
MILDYQMPEFSGIQALEKFAALPQIKDISVIMVTARVGKAERKAAFKYGVKDFLFKPVEKALLLKTIYPVLTDPLHSPSHGG